MSTDTHITLYGAGSEQPKRGGLVAALVGEDAGPSHVKLVEVQMFSDESAAETADAAAKAARTAAFGQETKRHKPIVVSAPGDVIDQIKIVDESDFTSGVLFIPEEMDFGNDKSAAQTIADNATYDEGTLNRVRLALSEIGYVDQVGNNIINHLNNRGILFRERA